MLVSDLDKMESIVESREDLSWDGWDVVRHTHAPNAMYFKESEFRDGQWFKKKVYPLTEQGWNIPNNIGRVYVQVEG